MALTDYELKLRARSWCNNLRQNGIITDDIVLQNCMSAFPMSSAVSNDGVSTSGEVLTVQPPSSDKQAYNYSIYDVGQFNADDSTGITPGDNDRFQIYNSDKKYITYDDNPYSANYARVDNALNAQPATMEWTLINRGDDKYSILGSNNKYLSIDNDKRLVVSTEEINNFSTWKLEKIDDFATFESVQFPGSWIASNNNDLYLSDSNINDTAKWLMLNLTAVENDNITKQSDNSNILYDLLNDKAVLDTQISTLIKDTIKLDAAKNILKLISAKTNTNITAMQQMYLDKVKNNNKLIQHEVGGNAPSAQNFYSDSRINGMQNVWSSYQKTLKKKITDAIASADTNYNTTLELLQSKMQEYEVFNTKLQNISTKIKDQMNYNTQSIDQQISKSNVLENTNKQLTMKRDKDVYLKTIAEINSNNYASIQSTEYRNLVVKIIITGILIIIFIFLLQSALNKYNININGQ